MSKQEEKCSKEVIQCVFGFLLIISIQFCAICFTMGDWILGLILIIISIVLLYAMPKMGSMEEEEGEYHSN